MLKLQTISKTFNGHLVLNDIDLTLNLGDITALIGKNGTGKTTLLKIITGETPPDSGVVLHGHETIGYIPQDCQLGQTVATAFNSQTKDWRKDFALHTTELENLKPNTSTDVLSAGQRTRLALARVLASDPVPTTLLLDEPTNNLDASGIEWLKQFITSFKGSVLFVSHDRAFINSTANKVIELDDGKLTTYGGNFDFYKQQKELDLQTKIHQYVISLEEHKRLEKDLKTKQARAHTGIRRRKPTDNDKVQFNWHQNNVQRSFSGQLKAAQTRLEKHSEIERPNTETRHTLNLSGDTHSHKLILRVSNISKKFDKQVLQSVNFELRGKERTHITGRNGNGKTTLLKIIAGLVQPDYGTVVTGEGVTIGYFAQDTDGLNHTKTAIENLKELQTPVPAIFREAHNLGLAACDLKKPVNKLSRGQQAKLGFTKLLLANHQLLVLDEPTNHMDLPTRESIEQALHAYDGAILFASHDAYFARKLTPNKEITLVDL